MIDESVDPGLPGSDLDVRTCNEDEEMITRLGRGVAQPNGAHRFGSGGGVGQDSDQRRVTG